MELLKEISGTRISKCVDKVLDRIIEDLTKKYSDYFTNICGYSSQGKKYILGILRPGKAQPDIADEIEGFKICYIYSTNYQRLMPVNRGEVMLTPVNRG